MAGRDLLADEPETGRDLLADEPDDGVTPVAVAEDQPGWDWLRTNVPSVFNAGHEFSAGIGEGLANLPNIVPNVANTAQSLYDLHFGKGTGEVAPEDQWQPWVSSLSENMTQAYPPMPGYETARRSGQISGSALPLGPAAFFGAPVVAGAGRGVGWAADRYIDPNENEKWAKTGEILAPIVSGVLAKGIRAGAPKIGITPESLIERAPGLTTWAAGGGPLAGMAVDYFAKPIMKAIAPNLAPYASTAANAVGRAAGDVSLPGLLGRSVATANDPRRQGAR